MLRFEYTIYPSMMIKKRDDDWAGIVGMHDRTWEMSMMQGGL